jgi:predicted DNA-binding antitoxin AbrB/MazE fold protein
VHRYAWRRGVLVLHLLGLETLGHAIPLPQRRFLKVLCWNWQGSQMTISARFENGVFRPLDDVHLKDGTVVEVVIPNEDHGAQSRPRSVRDFAFCGMWKDREDMADSVEYVNRLRGDPRG